MNIVIIGNGISGISAARNIRKKSNHHITVISAETEHFFSRTALMYVFMGHMKYENTKPYEDWFWTKNKINLLQKQVTKVDFKNKRLSFSDESDELNYDKLILATGSSSNKFGWPGQDLHGVQGLYSYQDLESLEAISDRIEHAVIIGGGLIGIELAEMLKSRSKKVSMLVRENSFWNMVLPTEESEMINKHIRDHHIDLRLSSELDEIIDNGNGYVAGIKTKDGEEISCEMVGLTVGVHPNITFLKGGELKIDRGILVNEYLETNIQDVYAIGDCCQHESPPTGRRPIEQIWYTGKIMGETLAQTICEEPLKYEPGVFFNSAKFLDIEYQTYGTIPAVVPEEEESFVWQHPSENILVRINFKRESRHITGINTFGIRMRHEVWDCWLTSSASIENVIINLAKANFDPEFFKRYESDILEKFNAIYKTNLSLIKK